MSRATFLANRLSYKIGYTGASLELQLLRELSSCNNFYAAQQNYQRRVAKKALAG